MNDVESIRMAVDRLEEVSRFNHAIRADHSKVCRASQELGRENQDHVVDQVGDHIISLMLRHDLR
jgi:hypothetical protein